MSNETNPKPAPLVKWVGGKRQLQDRILPVLTKDTDFSKATYFEPFFGGGAMLFALQPDKAVFSDLNVGLVNMYATVRDMPNEFVNALTAYESRYNHLNAQEQKDFYLTERSIFNTESRSGLQMAARFVFLNKAGFNGMYRENASGGFNIPFGKRRVISLGSPENVLAVSRALAKTQMFTQDYKETVQSAVAGDVVYFDPPYAPLTATSAFTDYLADGFGPEDQEKLKDLALELTKKEVRVVISNSSAELIRELYSGFEIEDLDATRAISASTAGRTPVTELLINNFKLLGASGNRH